MLLLRLGHWELPLWPGAPDEAAPDPDDALARDELRAVQEDGDLCASEERAG